MNGFMSRDDQVRLGMCMKLANETALSQGIYNPTATTESMQRYKRDVLTYFNVSKELEEVIRNHVPKQQTHLNQQPSQ